MTAEELTALADALRAIRLKLQEAAPQLRQRQRDAATRAIEDLTTAAAEIRWLAHEARPNLT